MEDLDEGLLVEERVEQGLVVLELQVLEELR